MSGGSFNYLYSIEDTIGIVPALDEMKRMYTELKNIDSRAYATIEMGCMIHDFEKGINKFNKLKDVMHSVEWYKSNDWDINQVKESLEDYSKENV